MKVLTYIEMRILRRSTVQMVTLNILLLLLLTLSSSWKLTIIAAYAIAKKKKKKYYALGFMHVNEVNVNVKFLQA